MNRSRFGEEQVIAILKERESGVMTADAARDARARQRWARVVLAMDRIVDPICEPL